MPTIFAGEEGTKTSDTSKPVKRRDFLKWTALAAAGVVGIGLGIGGETLLGPSLAKTTTQTATQVATQTVTTIPTPTITIPSSIIDAAGRTVALPSAINRIVTLHPLPTQAVWRLAPKKLLNIDRVFQSRLTTFLTDPTDLQLIQSLPVTGVYFDPPNSEQVASLKPDLIISMVGDPNLDNYQKTYGCPAIAAHKNTLGDYADSFRMIGQVVGNPDGGNQLADYWNDVINRVTAYTSTIPTNTKLKVYYGSHNAILTTPGTSTIMSSILDLAGMLGFAGSNPGTNIASTNESGTVSVEQLVSWNPDIIIVTNGNLISQVLGNAQLQNVNAVINKKVYTNPVEETFDGTNCLMGMVWASTTLYPEVVKLNLLTECQNYYSLFNNYTTLTSDQIQLPGQGW